MERWLDITHTIIKSHDLEIGKHFPGDLYDQLSLSPLAFEECDDSSVTADKLIDCFILELLKSAEENRIFGGLPRVDSKKMIKEQYEGYFPYERFERYKHIFPLFESASSFLFHSRPPNPELKGSMLSYLFRLSLKKIWSLFLTTNFTSEASERKEFLSRYGMEHLDLGQDDICSFPLSKEWQRLVNKFFKLGFILKDKILTLDSENFDVHLDGQTYMDTEIKLIEACEKFPNYFIDRNDHKTSQRGLERNKFFLFLRNFWEWVLGKIIALIVLLVIAGAIYVIGLSLYLCIGNGDCKLFKSILSLGDAPLDPHKWDYD